MKLIKALHILTILFASFQLCFAQDKSKAELFVEYDKAGCELLLSGTDAFINKLLDVPNSTGYVVIHPEKKFPNKGRWYEQLIRSEAHFAEFDKTRLKIIRSSQKDAAGIKFWIVPKDADKPDFVEEKWIEPVLDPTKPFLFGSVWNDDPCPVFIPDTYAGFLKAHPNTEGRIVIFNRSKKQFRNEANTWLKLFTKDFRIPRNRLKTFYGKNMRFTDVEFWIVPRKN